MSTKWAVAASILIALCLYGIDQVILVGLPRQGLLAGAAIGLVFGFTTPVPSDAGSAALQAVRTGLAFGVVTGLGFAFYRGTDLGMAWGIGGTLGVAGGDCAGLFLRMAR